MKRIRKHLVLLFTFLLAVVNTTDINFTFAQKSESDRKLFFQNTEAQEALQHIQNSKQDKSFEEIKKYLENKTISVNTDKDANNRDVIETYDEIAFPYTQVEQDEKLRANLQ